MRIVLDAMGSDAHPAPEVGGAIAATKLWGDFITLVGPEDELRAELSGEPIQILDAPDIVLASDKPVEAAKQKPNSSMAVGIQAVKSGIADAFVTVGNTGAAMAIGLFELGRMQGVKRPALCLNLPVRGGTTVFLDIGANADNRPDHLLQFGLMGSINAEVVLDRASPSVALLSTGEEEGKGSELVREADQLLQQSDLNYLGNFEPKEYYGGQADVVVSDGFTGNIMIKTSEAVAALIVEMLTEAIKSSAISSLGGAMARPAFRRVSKVLDPTEYGAAPLLGIDGLVFIGHGRSNSHAVVNALRVAREAVSRGLMDALRRGFQTGM